MTTKSLAHKFTSAVADDANTGHVRPSNWNADHNFFLGVNAQTGASYTFVDGDDWCLVSFSNGSAIAATLPQANSGTFVSGWICFVRNLGAGTVTITPTTSTIDGAATLALLSGHSAIIVSDGTNYTTLPMANLPIIVASGKTITLNNSLTLAGTDATTMTFPGASDTLAGLATAQTFTKQNIFNEATTVASASGAALDDVKVSAATTTITGTTTITRLAKVGLYQPTIDKPSGAVTVTDAATLYIDNAPVATNAATITNAWALLVGAGQSKFGDAISVTKTTASALHGVTVTNTSAGSGNTYCDFEASNGTATAQFGVVGTNYTTLGALVANDAFMLGITGNVTIMALTGSTTIKLAAGGSAAIVTVSSAGVTIAGTLSLPTTINLTTNGASTGIYWNDAATKSAIYISAGLNINFSPDNPSLILRYSGTQVASLSSTGALATSDTITVTKTVSGGTFAAVTGVNTSGGSGAATAFGASNGTYVASFAIAGTAYGGYGAWTANSTLVYNQSSGGIAIMADNASGTVRIAAGGPTTTMTVAPAPTGVSINGAQVSFGLLSVSFTQVTNWGLALNNTNAANGASFAVFLSNGTNIGNITNNNNTGVLYNLSSDRDLKEDERPFLRAREIIDRTKVYDFAWKKNQIRGVSVFAQELEFANEWQPGLVTPSKQKGGWQWAPSLFVPILIAGQQDANRRIDDHERRLARLEQMRLAA